MQKMEETNKKSIFDILLLTAAVSVGSFVILYLCLKNAIGPTKKNFGKVLGKKQRGKPKRNMDVMSSNNSSVSIEISTAEMD